MVCVIVDDNEISMNGYKCGVPERAARKGESQLRVETTHQVSGPPSTPDVRVDDHRDDEEQSAKVVDAETDDEHVDDAASKFGDPQQRNEDPARPNYSFDEEPQHHCRSDSCRPLTWTTLDVGQIQSYMLHHPRRGVLH